MTTEHASAVLVGSRAVLIRGAAGSGKSRLAWALLQAARLGFVPFVRLVGDDRVELQASHGRLLVQPALALQGMIEVRGLGIRRVAFEPMAIVGLVIDLGAVDAQRMPEGAATETEVIGLRLPRIAVAAGVDACPLILAVFETDPM